MEIVTSVILAICGLFSGVVLMELLKLAIAKRKEIEARTEVTKRNNAL